MPINLVFQRMDKSKYQCFVLHIVILLQDRECCFIQGNIDRYGMPLFGLAWDVTDAFAIAF